MKLGGLQKFSALDYPGRLACIVFTQGCNLDCPFCHNHQLISSRKPGSADLNTFFDFLNNRVGKLDGVVISGGEPTIQPDLIDFMGSIKELGFEIKLDTNGSNPHILQNIIDLNLVDYIAMDIKHNWINYSLAAGRNHSVQKYLDSVDIVRSSGVEYEFRTTVVPWIHNEESIVNISRTLKPEESYFIQKYRDEGVRTSNQNKNYKDIDLKSLAEKIKVSLPKIKVRS